MGDDSMDGGGRAASGTPAEGWGEGDQTMIDVGLLLPLSLSLSHKGRGDLISNFFSKLLGRPRAQ